MNLSREKSRYKDHAAKVHDAAWQCHFHYFHTHSFSTLFGRRGWLLFPCSISSIPGDDVNPIRKGSCHKTSAESNMRSYLLWRPDVNEQAAKSCLKHVRLLCRQNCRFNQDISGSHFVTFLSIVKALILHKWLSDFLSICEDTPSKISQTYTSSNVKTITWIVQLRISNLDNECTLNLNFQSGVMIQECLYRRSNTQMGFLCCAHKQYCTLSSTCIITQQHGLTNCALHNNLEHIYKWKHLSRELHMLPIQQHIWHFSYKNKSTSDSLR